MVAMAMQVMEVVKETTPVLITAVTAEIAIRQRRSLIASSVMLGLGLKDQVGGEGLGLSEFKLKETK